MNTALQNTILTVASDICDTLDHHWKHVSFIVDRRSILSIGWNQPFKTHPIAERFKYRYAAIHSELHAILKFPRPNKELYKYQFINVRIDKFGKLKMAKPCSKCLVLLSFFGVRQVEFSNSKGNFETMSLGVYNV
jgi:tRNA(Arg) A34 adenosine deaminase TadA